MLFCQIFLTEVNQGKDYPEHCHENKKFHCCDSLQRACHELAKLGDLPTDGNPLTNAQNGILKDFLED